MGFEVTVSTPVVDDIEFVACFNRAIAGHYQEAARYQKTLPEFALMRMRQVIEALCNDMAGHVGLQVSASHSLYQLITDLKDSGKFKKSIADDLHLIRIHANTFVHAEKLSPGSARGSFSSKELESITQNCRDALCRVLVAFATSTKGVNEVLVLQQRQFDLVTHQELIAKAVTAIQPKDKYLAGIAVDTLTHAFLAEEVGFVLTEQQKFQYWSLQRLAATFYLAAIELDAELDKVPFEYLDGAIENLTFQRSDAEYLYRFADVVVHGDIGDEWKAKGVAALEVAVSKGHLSAKALLAGIYYQNANYESSFKLALAAFESGELRALRVLFYYYAEGNASAIDKPKAKSYLEIGVENKYLPAITLLGKALCVGELLDKDKSLGLKYLRQAAELGDTEAINCLPLLDGTAERGMKELGLSLLSALENNKKNPKNNALQRKANGQLESQIKIGRNDLCLCGSGIKSKKCCNK